MNTWNACGSFCRPPPQPSSATAAATAAAAARSSKLNTATGDRGPAHACPLLSTPDPIRPWHLSRVFRRRRGEERNRFFSSRRCAHARSLGEDWCNLPSCVYSNSRNNCGSFSEALTLSTQAASQRGGGCLLPPTAARELLFWELKMIPGHFVSFSLMKEMPGQVLFFISVDPGSPGNFIWWEQCPPPPPPPPPPLPTPPPPLLLWWWACLF